jgi:hypothetical protein
MNAYTRVRLSLAALIFAVPAGAQATDTIARTDTSRGALSCPREGSMLRLWADAGGDSAARTTRAPRLDISRGAIDTVIRLDITDRSWQRENLSAGVSLGVGGTAGARRAPWHACAGATVTLGRVTATLHNVHGQIHLKADPGPLASVGRATGTTPPAPPRR